MNVRSAIRTKGEIADAIRSFTPAQWARLWKVAQIYSYALESEDLLQEAFTRALGDNERHCPVQIDVVSFLAGVMRSIASGEYERAKLRPTLVPIDYHGGHQEEAPDAINSTLGVDDQLMREQQMAGLFQEIITLFSDDQAARDIVEGRIADMSANELRELTGLDAKAYATKLKLIRRRIDKAFPKGLKS